MSAELDPLSELRFLTEALRAHAEWQQACGTVALPAADLESAAAAAQVIADPARAERAPVAARPAPAAARPTPAAAAGEISSSNYPLPTAADLPLPTPTNQPSLSAEERHTRLAVL